MLRFQCIHQQLMLNLYIMGSLLRTESRTQACACAIYCEIRESESCTRPRMDRPHYKPKRVPGGFTYFRLGPSETERHRGASGYAPGKSPQTYTEADDHRDRHAQRNDRGSPRRGERLSAQTILRPSLNPTATKSSPLTRIHPHDTERSALLLNYPQ